MLGHKLSAKIIDKLKLDKEILLYQQYGKLTDTIIDNPIVRIYFVDEPRSISEAKRNSMDTENILYVQVDPMLRRMCEYFPKTYFENRPLIGRPFIHGIFDCFTVIKDWFIYEHDIDLLWNNQRPFGWWESGQSLYLENAREAGFIPQTGIIKKGDIVTFAFGGSIVNHSAIYLGNNKVLHHLGGRFSCIESLTPALNHYKNSTWRHKELVNGSS